MVEERLRHRDKAITKSPYNHTPEVNIASYLTIAGLIPTLYDVGQGLEVSLKGLKADKRELIYLSCSRWARMASKLAGYICYQGYSMGRDV